MDGKSTEDRNRRDYEGCGFGKLRYYHDGTHHWGERRRIAQRKDNGQRSRYLEADQDVYLRRLSSSRRMAINLAKLRARRQ